MTLPSHKLDLKYFLLVFYEGLRISSSVILEVSKFAISVLQLTLFCKWIIPWKPYWLVIICMKYIFVYLVWKDFFCQTCTHLCWVDEDDIFTTSVLWTFACMAILAMSCEWLFTILIYDWNHNLPLICVRCTRWWFF